MLQKKQQQLTDFLKKVEISHAKGVNRIINNLSLPRNYKVLQHLDSIETSIEAKKGFSIASGVKEILSVTTHLGKDVIMRTKLVLRKSKKLF